MLDDLGGRIGRAWCETGVTRTDRHTVITELLEGQYSEPVRVVAFNTAQGWSRDVSEEIALDLLERMAHEGRDLTPSLERFLDRHAGTLTSSFP